MADAALDALIDRVRAARAGKTPLAITGGGTKAFYGEAPQGQPLDLRPLAGKAFLRPDQNFSRCASLSLTVSWVAPQPRSTASMRSISSATSSGVPSLSHSRMASAVRS